MLEDLSQLVESEEAVEVPADELLQRVGTVAAAELYTASMVLARHENYGLAGELRESAELIHTIVEGMDDGGE